MNVVVVVVVVVRTNKLPLVRGLVLLMYTYVHTQNGC
jgi:hypothetical protein